MGTEPAAAERLPLAQIRPETHFRKRTRRLSRPTINARARSEPRLSLRLLETSDNLVANRSENSAINPTRADVLRDAAQRGWLARPDRPRSRWWPARDEAAGAMLKGIVSALPALPFNYLTTFCLSRSIIRRRANKWIEIGNTRLTTPTDGPDLPRRPRYRRRRDRSRGGYQRHLARDRRQRFRSLGGVPRPPASRS